MRVTLLGSGSRGNAIVVEGSGGRVLVDAGFPPRTLASRLQAAGIAPASIEALLLTHEHVDHARGAAAAVARWGWPVVATPGTLGAVWPAEPGAGPARASGVALRAGGPQALVGGFEVAAIAVPHDAAEPVALLLTDRASGCRVGIALDLGAVPEPLAAAFQRVDVLVVESNHDEALLAQGPYPWPLKQRIRGGHGHLSNHAAARLAVRCAHRGLRAVVLAHLSEVNNRPALALACTRDALRGAGWRRDAVHVGLPTEVGGPWPARGPASGSGALAAQLSLAL